MGTDLESLDHVTSQMFIKFLLHTDIQIFISIHYISAVKVGVLQSYTVMHTYTVPNKDPPPTVF